MKKMFIYLLSGMLTLSVSYGQTADNKDLLLVDHFIGKKISIKKEKLESEALSKVFKGSFYKATPEYSHDDGTSSCDEFKLVVIDGKVVDLESTGETRVMNQLFSLLRDDFTIKDETDATTFELALDQIYPMGWSDKTEDKKHLLQDGKWLFLRGDFLGSKKGFIVSLGPDSRINQISYDLKAVAK